MSQNEVGYHFANAYYRVCIVLDLLVAVLRSCCCFFARLDFMPVLVDRELNRFFIPQKMTVRHNWSGIDQIPMYGIFLENTFSGNYKILCCRNLPLKIQNSPRTK